MEFHPTRQLVGSDLDYARIARRVGAGDLVRVRRGVVAPAAELQPGQRLRRAIEATALYLNNGTWFSHRSAALIHGLPTLASPLTLVEVIRTFGGHGNKSAHVHARAASLTSEEVVFVDGLPVTSLLRTVVDLACTVPFPEAVMVTDAALRAGVDREALLAAASDRYGCRKAQRAILFADPLSESPPESESRARIAMAGLPVPEIQAEIFSATGEFIARADFLWRGKRVVGEYDGEGKYDGEFGVSPVVAVRNARERQAALEAQGYFVLRWGKDVLRIPGELERRVRHTLAMRPWLPAGT